MPPQNDGDAMTGVFDDLRVVDFSCGMAGPLASMILADHGAEVIKLEGPSGDFARNWPAFEMWNRGKKSVLADLRTATGRDAAYRLVASSQVVLETFRPGVADAMGVGYETLSRVNPGILYCSISGFSNQSAFTNTKAYEGIVAAGAGLWNDLDDVQGSIRRPVGAHPDKLYPTFKLACVNSFAASQLAVQAIIAALLQRRRTGVVSAQHIHTSLLQGAASLLIRRDFALNETFIENRSSEARHRGRRLSFMTAECSDGRWIQMCARQDRHFMRWLSALGLEERCAEERYAHGPIQIPTVADVEELESEIRQRMRGKTQQDWMDIFTTLDVGADPFLTPGDFLSHPQMTLNNRVVTLSGSDGRELRQPGPLVALTEMPAEVNTRAPRLGESTPEALDLVVSQERPAAGDGSSDGSLGTQTRARAPLGTRQPDYPLSGLVVLELAYFIAAPLAGSLLAQLGARVIKVEPLEGDPFRRVGVQATPLLHGKESLALDLKSDEGRNVLQRLISQADVLYTNFRPQAHEKLACDYKSVHAINPRLVYLYAASYGSAGPWSKRAAFHSTPNALCGSGIMQAGFGNPPVDDDWPDPVSGLGAATAILVGLAARERTGRGEYIETTMLCSSAYAFSRELLSWEANDGRASALDHEQRGRCALDHLYRCRRGWLLLEVMQEKEWTVLAEALGRPEWLTDDRFASAQARMDNDLALTDLIASRLSTADAWDWEKLLSQNGVAAVQADAIGATAFLRSSGIVEEASYEPVGHYLRSRPYYEFSGASSGVGAACLVGEHSLSILSELGYSNREVAELLRAEVVGDSGYGRASGVTS
jgi:crotonobetainyl-CoA:carnitine CoA-transferase CaiB-like acyl-CoA transferase